MPPLYSVKSYKYTTISILFHILLTTIIKFYLKFCHHKAAFRMRDIFEYLDYRGFLQDFYAAEKQSKKFFSYRYMADKIGVNHSSLIKILARKRHLSGRNIPAVLSLCNLQGPRADYFTNLVYFTKAKSDTACKPYLEKMLALRDCPSARILKDRYEYFSKWYYAAVRSLLDCIEFRGDYALLARKLNPPITESRARAAIALLVRLKFIRKDTRGVYRVTDAHVTTGESWESAAISTYQRETIQLAASSLERDKKETRDISTLTMSVDREALDDIKNILREARAAIIRRVDEIPDDRLDRVYQLNMQYIPLSKYENT
ncbi:MAG: TIGR02147 family protein [Chitinivibrionales bacterium]|nr:TIGR02147 family protein [Chitinivibrionales bacterium]